MIFCSFVKKLFSYNFLKMTIYHSLKNIKSFNDRFLIFSYYYKHRYIWFKSLISKVEPPLNKNNQNNYPFEVYKNPFQQKKRKCIYYSCEEWENII